MEENNYNNDPIEDIILENEEQNLTEEPEFNMIDLPNEILANELSVIPTPKVKIIRNNDYEKSKSKQRINRRIGI